MALPGHRRTSSDKRRRAAHFALEKVSLGSCAKCHKLVRPHHACANCGFYRGRTVQDTKRATARLLKRSRPVTAASEIEKQAEKTERRASAKKASKA